MLSAREAAVAADALEAWIESFDEATDQIIADRALVSPEQLCEAVAATKEDRQAAVTAHAKLRRITDECISASTL